MVRKQILLKEEQLAALEGLAKERGVSLSDLIGEGIENVLRSTAIPRTAELRERALRIAGRFRSGLCDLSTRHDEYLEEAFRE